MTGRILMIQHMEDPRNDRVAARLARRGFTLDWRSPARGDALPHRLDDHDGAVVYGGVQSVNDADREPWLRDEIAWIRRWVESDRPYLGLCLGGQLLARSLGAAVGPHPAGLHEAGFVPIRPTGPGAGCFPAPLHVYQWHHEGFAVPAGADLLATGDVYPNQAFRVGRRAFGLQFHPEATPALRGQWLDASGHLLASVPGAHDRARQEADAVRFDRPMEEWLFRFMDTHFLPAR